MDDFRRRPVRRPTRVVNAVPGTPSTQPVNPGAPVSAPVNSVAPKRPLSPDIPTPAVQPQPAPPEQLPDISQESLNAPAGMSPKPPKSVKKRVLLIISGIVAALLLAAAGAFIWYQSQLAAVDPENTSKTLVTIAAGSTPANIAQTLKDEGLIRSESAFLWYTRIQGVQNTLQAGAYRLSPSETTPQIVKHLSSGAVDTYNITFLPGATLRDNRETFIKAGYEASEVDAAFAKTYDSPLFEGKPASADLEGYIYGETYSFSTDATVESVLERVFEEFYKVVEKDNLVAGFAAQGLSLYEGITLASIVQREASPGGSDMPQIAQVFYTRLSIDMQLGSDVTYQYIADKMGVPRDTNLDSPYNTRRYTGLPPGPISAPGEKALTAVANPAGGDFIYFLSGDDNITYYARTLEGHEANIRDHCQEKCKII